MTKRKLSFWQTILYGSVCSLIIAGCAALPMLFGQPVLEAFNNPLQAGAIIIFGAIGVMGIGTVAMSGESRT